MRVNPRLKSGRCHPRGEPVAAELEETAVGPVARRDEEDEQQDRAVDAGSVQKVRAHEEQKYEGRRGIRGDEEEWDPAASTFPVSMAMLCDTRKGQKGTSRE